VRVARARAPVFLPPSQLDLSGSVSIGGYFQAQLIGIHSSELSISRARMISSEISDIGLNIVWYLENVINLLE
jgi:hypothetical protein